MKFRVQVARIDQRYKVLQNPTDLLNQIGQHLVASSRARIRTTKTDPEGNQWKPWKHDYKTGSLLYQTGTLYGSINYVLQGRQVQVSSSAPYAEYLQRGTQHMPARPFLGISTGDKDAILRFVQQALQKA